MISTGYDHIIMQEDRVPVIAGTSVKVIELVIEKIAYGWSAEELHFQHPDLSMGQIHAALAYYWDHADELDADIAQRRQTAQQISQTASHSPLRQRLRGFIP